MANTDSPWGAKYLEGPKLMIRDAVTASYATPLYLQEILGKKATGYVEIGPVGGQWCGIAESYERSDGMMVGYVPASDSAYTYKAIFNAHPYSLYAMQEENSGTAFTVAAAGLCAPIVRTHSGSTTTYLAGTEIDRTGSGTSAQTGVRLVRIWDEYFDAGADAFNTYGDSAKWIIQLEDFTLAPNIGGI